MVEAQPIGITPVVGATAGDLASLTAGGLLADSGVSSAVAHDPATLYVAANGDDATALRGRSDLVFATLNAAAAAALSGDTIRVGVGTFAPLTVALPNSISLIGAGRPCVDSITAPTTLSGGTVVQGPLIIHAGGASVQDLGVDSGSAVCTALYSGNAQDALVVNNVIPYWAFSTTATGGTFTITAGRLNGATTTTAPIAYNALASTVQSALTALVIGSVTVTGSPGAWNITPAAPGWETFSLNTGSLTGGTTTPTLVQPTGVAPLPEIRIRNCSFLCQSPTAQTHACLLQNVSNSSVENVETWYGAHGLPIKGINVNVNGLLANGHGTSNLYFKSDSYAICEYVNATNITVNAISSSGASSTGIYIQGATGQLAFANVSNFNVGPGIKNGVIVDGSAVAVCVNVYGGQIYSSGTVGVAIQNGVDRATISSVQAVGSGGKGFTVDASCSRTVLSACEASNSTSDGFNLASGSSNTVVLSGCGSYVNGGYGYNASGGYVYGAGLLAESNTSGPQSGTINQPIYDPYVGIFLNGAVQTQHGSGGLWLAGQNAGAGSGDDTFGFYSGTYGGSHGLVPVFQLNSSDASAALAGKLTMASGVVAVGQYPTTIAYAATVTPALYPNVETQLVNVGTLTGNVTVAAPTGTPFDGQNIRFRFSQDSTGGRTITWNAVYEFGTDVTAGMVPNAASSHWEMLATYCAANSNWRMTALVRGF